MLINIIWIIIGYCLLFRFGDLDLRDGFYENLLVFIGIGLSILLSGFNTGVIMAFMYFILHYIRYPKHNGFVRLLTIAGFLVMSATKPLGDVSSLVLWLLFGYRLVLFYGFKIKHLSGRLKVLEHVAMALSFLLVGQYVFAIIPIAIIVKSTYLSK